MIVYVAKIGADGQRTRPTDPVPAAGGSAEQPPEIQGLLRTAHGSRAVLHQDVGSETVAS